VVDAASHDLFPPVLLYRFLLVCTLHAFPTRRSSDLFVTDTVAPYLLLAQAIGRWGNFVNQEAHGGEVRLEFLQDTLHLPQFIVDGMHIKGTYYHPTFLYESVWSILGRSEERRVGNERRSRRASTLLT